MWCGLLLALDLAGTSWNREFTGNLDYPYAAKPGTMAVELEFAGGRQIVVEVAECCVSPLIKRILISCVVGNLAMAYVRSAGVLNEAVKILRGIGNVVT